jgi:glutaredoxin
VFRFIVIPICLVGLIVSSQIVVAEDGSAKASNINVVVMEVFVRGDRSSAQLVENYLRDLRDRTTGLEILVHDVVKERDQLAKLYELSGKAGRDKPSVPEFHCCDRMYFGFENSATSGPEIEALFTADVYTRSTCPRCAKAKKFLAQLQGRWPAIRFRILDVDSDTAARARWEALCRGGGAVPGLPTIDFAGRVIIGYQGDEITGQEIEQLIQKCSGNSQFPTQSPNPTTGTTMLRFLDVPPSLDSLEFDLPEEASDDEIGSEDIVTDSAATTEPIESIDVPWFGKLRVDELGLPLFTFLVGIVDGFNPCAMWILVFLLSVLVNIKDRRKIILIAGTFVVVSGLAYFAFMAAWLNLFLLIGIARPVQIALGILALFIGVVNVKDFFAFKKGISLSIPESQKPGLYRRVRQIVEAKYISIAIGGAIVLAVIVNTIELLCTAGLPALYTQVLTLQQLPVWQNYAYLALYIAAYMFDDTLLLVVVVVTLSHHKLQEREGRWLKLLSGVVILLLGMTMIFFPSWLTWGQ